MIDLDSTEWHLFKTWATDFYKEAINICIDAAGKEPNIFAKLLERSLPSLLELYSIWQKDKSGKPE